MSKSTNILLIIICILLIVNFAFDIQYRNKLPDNMGAYINEDFIYDELGFKADEYRVEILEMHMERIEIWRDEHTQFHRNGAMTNKERQIQNIADEGWNRRDLDCSRYLNAWNRSDIDWDSVIGFDEGHGLYLNETIVFCTTYKGDEDVYWTHFYELDDGAVRNEVGETLKGIGPIKGGFLDE